jgi:hypothetical protein
MDGKREGNGNRRNVQVLAAGAWVLRVWEEGWMQRNAGSEGRVGEWRRCDGRRGVYTKRKLTGSEPGKRARSELARIRPNDQRKERRKTERPKRCLHHQKGLEALPPSLTASLRPPTRRLYLLFQSPNRYAGSQKRPAGACSANRLENEVPDTYWWDEWVR